MWGVATTLISVLVVVTSYPHQEIPNSGSGYCRLVEDPYQLLCDGYVDDAFSISNILQEDNSQIMNNLKSIQLRNGKIRSIPQAAFRQLPHVTQVVFSNMSLETIEKGAFEGVVNLKNLDLGYNKLRELPDDMLKMARVKSLRLDGNTGLIIPTNGPLLNAPKLRWLSLQKCDIEHFPGVAFSKTPHLTHLDLSHNRLEQLPEVLFENTTLTELYLHNNNFKTLSLSIFQRIHDFPRQPQTVTMANNNWNCDCRLAPVITWLIQEKDSLNVSRDPLMSRLKLDTKCSTPNAMRMKSWNAIEEFSCNI